MKPEQALKRFRELLPKQQRTVVAGVQAMLRFYETERAEGCSVDQDGDMLLFQWGTYDWGKGEQFELDVTRQFIWDARSWLRRLFSGPENDDPDIWQLSLTFRFPPTEECRAFGNGNQWCHSPGKVAEIQAYIRANTAFQALAERENAIVDLSFESAE